MKAWYVSIGDGEIGEIVLAETAGQAKTRAECYDPADFLEMRARRAPEFDGDRSPTDRDYLENGWWVLCHQCGLTIYSEDTAHFDQRDWAYCSEGCAPVHQQTTVKKETSES